MVITKVPKPKYHIDNVINSGRFNIFSVIIIFRPSTSLLGSSVSSSIEGVVALLLSAPSAGSFIYWPIQLSFFFCADRAPKTHTEGDQKSLHQRFQTYLLRGNISKFPFCIQTIHISITNNLENRNHLMAHLLKFFCSNFNIHPIRSFITGEDMGTPMISWGKTWGRPRKTWGRP